MINFISVCIVQCINSYLLLGYKNPKELILNQSAKEVCEIYIDYVNYWLVLVLYFVANVLIVQTLTRKSPEILWVSLFFIIIGLLSMQFFNQCWILIDYDQRKGLPYLYFFQGDKPFNPLTPGAAYWCQMSLSSLVQEMAWRQSISWTNVDFA